MTRSAFLLPDSPLYPFTTSSFQHFFFLLSAYRDRCVLHTCFNRPNQYLLRHLWILVADSTIWSGEMAEKQTESSTIEGELIIVVRSSSFGASCHYSSFPQQSLFLSSPFRQPSTVLSNRWETCTFGLSMLFFNTFLRKNDNTFFYTVHTVSYWQTVSSVFNKAPLVNTCVNTYGPAALQRGESKWPVVAKSSQEISARQIPLCCVIKFHSHPAETRMTVWQC